MLIASYIDCRLTAVELLCGILYSRNTSECCTSLSVVHGRPGCDHHFFDNAVTTPTIFMSFRTLISNLTSKISNSKKMTARQFENFQTYNGGRETNEKLIILTQNGLYRLKMTNGFQISSQNLNSTSCDPFWPKTNENWQIPVFGRFLAKKG